MASERFDRTASKPVVWSSAGARLDGRVPRREPAWSTSLAAAGMTIILFTLTLFVLAAWLVPRAV